MRTSHFLLPAGSSIILLFSGCSSDDNNQPGLANPASVYCAEQGGSTEIVGEDDGEVGYCNLSDGTRVEEWEFYRSRVTTP